MEPVNERSTSIITASFYDEDESAVTPTAGTYEIHDVGSGTVILAATALPSLAETVDLTITAEQNRILSEVNSYEKRLVTVKWTYAGGAKNGTAQYDYLIKNLSQVSA